MQLLAFQSLRAKFAVFVALSVLVITCIFGTVIGASAISRHKEQTGHQLAEYAASMVDRLDRDMHSRAKELSVLSALEALPQPRQRRPGSQPAQPPQCSVPELFVDRPHQRARHGGRVNRPLVGRCQHRAPTCFRGGAGQDLCRRSTRSGHARKALAQSLGRSDEVRRHQHARAGQRR
jgi:hypothetical protein